MDEQVFVDDANIQQLWEYCKTHFYTEEQVNDLIEQAIQALVLGG